MSAARRLEQLALPFDAPRPPAAAPEPEAPPAWPAQRDLDARDDFAEELAFAQQLLERNGREARELSNAYRRQKRAAALAAEEAARSSNTHDAARLLSRANAKRVAARESARKRRAALREKRAEEKAAAKAAPPRRGPLARSQALPVADAAAAAAPRGKRGHVLAVAVTLTDVHADVWTVTARPLYGHAAAWRNTLRRLAKVGRTRAYDASQPRRRCTWDSLDGDTTL